MADLRKLVEIGFAVKFRNGDWNVALSTQDGDIGLYDVKDLKNVFVYLSNFKEDLTDEDYEANYDIMEIRGYAERNQEDMTGRSIIWTRNEEDFEKKFIEVKKQTEEVREKIRDIREELRILENQLLDITVL